MSKYLKKVISAGAVLLVALSGFVGLSATAALAAEPHATVASVKSLEFTETTIEQGSTVRIDGKWSLPDDPETPAGFTVDLPPELQGRTDGFDLLDPSGVPMGTCSVTPTTIECDFDKAYLEANPKELKGDFHFWVTVLVEVTEETEKTFEIGEHEVSVIVTPGAGDCPDCEFEGRDSDKIGTIHYDRGVIIWTVRPAAPVEGAVGGEEIHVRDILGPNQELITETGGRTYPYVEHTNELVNGSPGNWTPVSTDAFVVDGADVSWTAEEGYWYIVRYASQITDGGASDSYSNKAEVTIASAEPVLVERELVYQGGGGTGIGTNVGAFSITKTVEGDTANLGDLVFTGSYVVTLPDDEGTEEGEFEVVAGETWESDLFPRGSTVQLTEFTPVDPSNILWDTPKFSLNDFELVGGERTEVQLVNHASAKTGYFDILKLLTGDAAELVPADTVFEVAYSYEAGDGFEAGSGVVEVSADGEAVTVGDIPTGAVVTLVELDAVEIANAVWEAPQFSTNEFVVEDGVVVEVSLTNTLTAVPDEPVEETPEVPGDEKPANPQPEKNENGLAQTGSTLNTMVGLGAALSLIFGSALVLRQRLRSSRP